MTQYLAIVWRYNRRLGQMPGRARPGLFARLHARGGWFVALFYVLVCLAYGEIITTVHDNRWLMSVLLAIGFTSTLMHYYFDGFIWKLRHKQNREGLALDGRAREHRWRRRRRSKPHASPHARYSDASCSTSACRCWCSPSAPSSQWGRDLARLHRRHVRSPPGKPARRQRAGTA